MNATKKSTNEDKLAYLILILNENKPQAQAGAKGAKIYYYTISLIRFGNKVPVVIKEPASTDISTQIEKYSSTTKFNPDYIIIDLYAGKAHNIKKPFATFKFDYKSRKTVN